MSHLDRITKTFLSGNSSGVDALCQQPRTKTRDVLYRTTYIPHVEAAQNFWSIIFLYSFSKIILTLRHWLPCAGQNLCLDVPILNNK